MPNMDNCTRLTLIDAAKTFGEGDIQKGLITIKAIADRLMHARTKHPLFASSLTEGMQVVMAEEQEFVRACSYETAERQKDEALDVIATSIRFYNGEWHE